MKHIYTASEKYFLELANSLILLKADQALHCFKDGVTRCVLFMIVNDTVFKSICSAPRDYSSIDGDITFSPGNVSFDVVITITDDNVFENELKEFTIELTINSTAVNVEPAMATILITDDDRMLLHIKYNFYLKHVVKKITL